MSQAKQDLNANSPEYVKTSLAAAMALGLRSGRFYRDAYPRTLNLLLTYMDGCRANCSYCGLARQRQQGLDGTTFIRVEWPMYLLNDIIERLKRPMPQNVKQVQMLKRICVSMVTHPLVAADCIAVVRRLRLASDLPISVLACPTAVADTASFFAELKAAGVDRVGIAIDAATAELFAAHRGLAVNGPHQWQTYWQALKQAVEVFGPDTASIHLVVGLGETEQELVAAIARAVNSGAQAHLFSFCPEPGSRLEKQQPPSLGKYRRSQLAAYLLNLRMITANQIQYNASGQIIDYGQPLTKLLGEELAAGKPFMTAGCPDSTGCVACNRPFGNERPGPILRNYPIQPDDQDIQLIREQLWEA